MSNPIFELYGDESSFQDMAVFATVVVPVARKIEIERALARVKTEFGAAPDTRIHCKQLLHSSARAKSKWAHLDQARTFELLERAAGAVENAGARGWVGCVNKTTAPDGLLFEGGTVQNITNEHFPWIAYSAAMAPLSDLIPFARVKGFMDPDTKRLQWMGRNKQMRLSQGFFPINHNDVRFEPVLISGAKPAMIDIADVVAHCAAHALSNDRPENKIRYETVLQRFPQGISMAHFEAIPGPIFSIKANTSSVSTLREYFSQFLAE